MGAQARRKPQGILPYFQGFQRSMGVHAPVKTGKGSIPFALSRQDLLNEY
jgi:hypothetical protein